MESTGTGHNKAVANRLFAVLLIVAAACLLANLALYFSGASVWDDAYFFSRYADNFRDHGNFAWNASDDPAYGLTSLLYAGQIFLLRSIDHSGPVLGLYISSMVWGFIALGALWWLMRKHGSIMLKKGPRMRIGWLVLPIAIAFNAPALAAHFSSGMDTMMAVAYMAIYLIFLKRFEPALSPGKSFVLGLLGGLAWFVRPELLIFGLGIPVALLFFHRRKLIRSQAAYLLLFTAFFLLTAVLISFTFFGTPVPLSFYVKHLYGYGSGISEAYSGVSLMQFLAFIGHNWLPFLLIAAGMFLNFKSWKKGFPLVDKMILLFMLLHWVYLIIFVVPIMGYQQRFFFPTWPALIYLGLRSASHLLYENPNWLKTFQVRLHGYPSLGLAGLIFVLVVGLSFLQMPDNARGKFAKFELDQVYGLIGANNWACLPAFSAMDDDLVIASTELGILGAMNPDKRIVDMTGLHDAVVAQEGLDATRLLRIERPDVLYMPHPDYRSMTASIRNSDAFREDYLFYPAEKLHSWLGIALRKKSPQFSTLQHIVSQQMDVKN